MVAAGEQQYGLAALTAKGKGSFIAAAEGLLTIRNQGQHGGTDLLRVADVRRTCNAVEPLLDQLIEQAQPLTAYPWLFVERLDWSDDDAAYTVTAVEATGESPAWPRRKILRQTPLQRGRLYAFAQAAGDALPLFPFCLVQDCSECGNRELYVPVSTSGDRLMMISIDSRHTLREDAVPNSLSRALEYWLK